MQLGTLLHLCARTRTAQGRRDARVSVAGVNYEVDPDLAGETVILRWGIFDNELYVEHGDKRFGPYAPVGGPIPLYRYRTFKKSPTQQRGSVICTDSDGKRIIAAAGTEG